MHLEQFKGEIFRLDNEKLKFLYWHLEEQDARTLYLGKLSQLTIIRFISYRIEVLF